MHLSFCAHQLVIEDKHPTPAAQYKSLANGVKWADRLDVIDQAEEFQPATAEEISDSKERGKVNGRKSARKRSAKVAVMKLKENARDSLSDGVVRAGLSPGCGALACYTGPDTVKDPATEEMVAGAVLVSSHNLQNKLKLFSANEILQRLLFTLEHAEEADLQLREMASKILVKGDGESIIMLPEFIAAICFFGMNDFKDLASLEEVRAGAEAARDQLEKELEASSSAKRQKTK